MRQVNRRAVVRGLAGAGVWVAAGRPGWAAEIGTDGGLVERPLEEFGYGEVEVRGRREVTQREATMAVVLGLKDAEMLRPVREMSAGAGGAGVGTGWWVEGKTAAEGDRAASGLGPEGELGGWYGWRPGFDFHHDDAGFAPGHALGQWTSAMSRVGASAGVAGGEAMRARVRGLHAGLGSAVGPGYFAQTRFPTYTLDKLLCGLVDGHELAGDAGAWEVLERVRRAAEGSLPGGVVDREMQYRMGRDASWMWDEGYTLPENLYRAYAAGAGGEYRTMARAYLDNAGYFEPLARGEVAMADRHAYSYTNALCSAMQAWLVDGSAMHLRAAVNGWAMIEAQSFATGGWGPDELFRKPGYGEVRASLTKTHNSFEVPCGSFAQMKLMRYLLRATRDGRYGDAMERVIWNGALGALPLRPDGRSFYYADYNEVGQKVYSDHRWPCCAGTLPQVVADYGVSGFLREPGAVWVVLYGAAVARWKEGGETVEMEVSAGYPEEGRVRLEMRGMVRPVEMEVKLRVPRWVRGGARVRVNGEVAETQVEGGFAGMRRAWRAGDVVEMELPMDLRLEGIPAELPGQWWFYLPELDGTREKLRPGFTYAEARLEGAGLQPSGSLPLDTVALLRGPEVLFAVREPGDAGTVMVKNGELLRARRTGAREWRVMTAKGERRFVPWTELGMATGYSTYVKVV